MALGQQGGVRNSLRFWPCDGNEFGSGWPNPAQFIGAQLWGLRQCRGRRQRRRGGEDCLLSIVLPPTLSTCCLPFAVAPGVRRSKWSTGPFRRLRRTRLTARTPSPPACPALRSAGEFRHSVRADTEGGDIAGALVERIKELAVGSRVRLRGMVLQCGCWRPASRRRQRSPPWWRWSHGCVGAVEMLAACRSAFRVVLLPSKPGKRGNGRALQGQLAAGESIDRQTGILSCC